MAYAEDLTSTPSIPIPAIQNAEKARELTSIVAFVAVGLFVSAMSLAITSAEWLSEGAITVALASAG